MITSVSEILPIELSIYLIIFLSLKKKGRESHIRNL